MQGRQTAYKLWIAEIIDADYTRQEGEWEPNSLDIKGIKVARVNVLGTITEVFVNPTGDYAAVTIEDGSASVAIRVFKGDVRLVTGLNIGDSILVIGRPKQYQNEIYIVPETVKKLDHPAWMKVRKAELMQARGIIQQKVQPAPQEASVREVREELIANNKSLVSNEGVRQKMLNLLEKQGELGMDIDMLIQATETEEEEAEKIIEELIKEGEIYMSRPGVLKII
ncbi:hypothetical protein HYS50_02830 [Candidatus Woesearchaeota archaeon]|nr:hypothetical protein [Candidatus Woesearchaeota archaeon]